MALVVCRKGGSASVYFTDGKAYPAVRVGESEGLYTLTDDSGNVRIVIADEPSGHLMDETGMRAVGTFHRAGD
jgi:hypothetical protein